MVPERTQQTLPPREMASPAPVGEVTVRIASVTAVDIEAQGPGEVAGSGVAVTVEVVNASAAAVDLSTAYVNLLDSSQNPGLPSVSGDASALPAQVAPGATVTGRYLFTVGAADRTPITVYVSSSATAPVASFKGDVR